MLERLRGDHHQHRVNRWAPVRSQSRCHTCGTKYRHSVLRLTEGLKLLIELRPDAEFAVVLISPGTGRIPQLHQPVRPRWT